MYIIVLFSPSSFSLWEFLEEREERVWTAPEPSEDYWDDDGDHDEGSLCGGGAMN